jgi:hypothetical protein
LFYNLSLNSPWYFYVLSLVAALLLSAWLYAKNYRLKEAPVATLWVLFGLRFLSFSLLFFFLLNIFFKHIQNQTENPVILVAIDNSSSMISAKDSAFIKKEFLANYEALKQTVGSKFELKPILFGKSIKQTETAADFSEKETDIENLFKELENNYSGQNIGALVIASDGIYNRGSNPVQASERLGFPIYSIACGDTNQNKDVLIQKVNHNQIAYLGNNFPVEVAIGSKLLKGKSFTISLSSNGKLLAEQQVFSTSDNYSGNCTFTVNATNTGLVNYSVLIKPLTEEKNTSNNRRSFFVEVIDNRDKILLLSDAPHPDVSAIREALSNYTNYELEFGQYANFNKPLKAYSLVILHGITSGQMSILTNCLQSSVPFWLVNPLLTDNLPGIKISNSLNRFNDSEPCYNKEFSLFGTSEDFKKFVGQLPAVKTVFGNYSVSNSASSLINQKVGSVETENPILLFNESNGLKNALFLGDGLWRWKFRDFSEHNNHNLFNELIGKTVQYLAVKSDKSFFRITPPKLVNENEPVEFGAEVYNKSYETITLPDVNLVLTKSNGEKFNYTFSKTSHAYKLNIGQLAPGEYSYEASVKNDGVFLTKKGSLTVLEVVAEKINTVANHGLLFQLSARSGGKVYYPTELEQLGKALLSNETIKPITYSQSSVSSLIELKWLLILIFALLIIEWLIRKRHLHI